MEFYKICSITEPSGELTSPPQEADVEVIFEAEAVVTVGGSNIVSFLQFNDRNKNNAINTSVL
jgi:hypothetical protein